MARVVWHLPLWLQQLIRILTGYRAIKCGGSYWFIRHWSWLLEDERIEL